MSFQTAQGRPESSSPIQRRVATVFIPVKDIEQARAWYGRLLGFEERDCEIAYGHLCRLPTAGAEIVLDTMPMWGGQEPGGAAPIETPVVMLTTDDLQASLAYVADLGAERITDIENDHWFVLKDPDGNKLMICKR